MALPKAYVYRAPAGIPGSVSRLQVATIKPEILDTANTPASYGAPVKLVGGKLQAIAAAADAVYGFLVRPFPAQANAVTNSAAPQGGTVADVLLSGYMMVQVSDPANTAAKNAAVNLTSAGALAITAGAGGAAIPTAFFEGEADPYGCTEIRFNI